MHSYLRMSQRVAPALNGDEIYNVGVVHENTIERRNACKKEGYLLRLKNK